MSSFRRGALIVAALVSGACLAASAGPSAFAEQGDTQQMGSEPPQSVPRTDGAPASYGPLGASGDTVPAKYSEKNDADDKLPLGAYRLKHLTAEQRQAIYRDITGKTAHGRPNDKIYPVIGTLVPSSVELQPMPADTTAQVPDTKGLKFVAAQDKVVLVDPVSMMVVGVLPN